MKNETIEAVSVVIAELKDKLKIAQEVLNDARDHANKLIEEKRALEAKIDADMGVKTLKAELDACRKATAELVAQIRCAGRFDDKMAVTDQVRALREKLDQMVRTA